MVTVDASVGGFWDGVAEQLRNRISSQDWSAWFVGARAVELGPERIVVELVNEFAVRWVDDRFRAVLEQTVAATAGVPLVVELVARVPQPSESELAQAAPSATEAALDPEAAAVSEEPPAEERVVLAAAQRASIDRAEPTPPIVAATQFGAARGSSMTEAELRAELSLDGALPDASLPVTAVASGSGTYGRPSGEITVPPSAVARDQRRIIDPALTGVGQLNDRYRFETFVIGPGNQMVHAAALSVAETPAQSYNPLFVYGPTGLGKTHLLHAIGHYMLETRPEARVAYITTEEFLNRFTAAIQNTKTPEGRELRDRFKAFFREVDVLLMDDVQFLAGRGVFVQEELFHLFNALHQNGKQIVLTSDVKPDLIPKLEERLRSRFAWGLIADIETPDRETRIAILRKKAQVDRFDVPAEVFALIAERITTNVRELEGALTRVVAAAGLSGREITTDLAMRVLESFSPGENEPVTIDRIQQIVCEHFALDREELLSPKRTQALAGPRQIAMYLSRVLTPEPATQVALRFNRKDHSTVLHAEHKIDTLIKSDQQTHDLIAQLTATVRGTGRRVGAER
ncbi:MAG: chromosomal replication initiator protein DnaA [Thermoleophilia bacterium]|nr:chromosomal replication initiator protein DnaA [Thermoleophilia bacterium]